MANGEVLLDAPTNSSPRVHFKSRNSPAMHQSHPLTQAFSVWSLDNTRVRWMINIYGYQTTRRYVLEVIAMKILHVAIF